MNLSLKDIIILIENLADGHGQIRNSRGVLTVKASMNLVAQTITLPLNLPKPA